MFSMKAARRVLRCFFRFAAPAVFIASAGLWATDDAVFRAAVADEYGAPVGGLTIILSPRDGGPETSLTSDCDGILPPARLAAGIYGLKFELNGRLGAVAQKIELDPGSEVFAEFLFRGRGVVTLSVRSILEDDFTPESKTRIYQSQIRALPTGHSIWSVIENQDLSAVANRVDIGGAWSSVPALFSSRGGSSWTQNTYLLNGLDVTDPYLGGTPLFFPDIRSLSAFSLHTAGHPASELSPGAYVRMSPAAGGERHHGAFSVFYSDKALSSSNITPALEKEGIRESNTVNSSYDAHFGSSGPIIPGKLHYSLSGSAFRVSRDLAEYDPEDEGYIHSALTNLRYAAGSHTFRFLWTGQIVRNPSAGAGRKIPQSATLDRKDYFNVFQLLWDWKISGSHRLSSGFGFSNGDYHSRFQDGAPSPHALEIFVDRPSGAAPFASRDNRRVLDFFVRGNVLNPGKGGGLHRIEYGLGLKSSRASSAVTIRDGIHLRFFEGLPLEIVRFNSPGPRSEEALEASIFAEDAWTLGSHLSVRFGLNMNYARGWVPGNGASAQGRISWLNLSPRAGLVVPLTRSGKSTLRFFAGRYHFRLPLNYLSYGNPNALGGLAYSWNDLNGDNIPQESETGRLLRREGPLFASIDTRLKRPFTDELSAGFARRSNSGWRFGVTAYLRRTKNLIAAVNTGVPLPAYETRTIHEIGDDRIPGTHDDLEFVVYDQKPETFGRDFFLLANTGPGQEDSDYYGLDVNILKRTASRFSFFFSFTATHAMAATNPGNTAWENDEGVIGTLYDNPNTLINSRGRPAFDRGFTARVGIAAPLPGGFRFGGLAKYYDGQPFARKIIVRGLRQGPFYIQAHARGVARYEFNMNVDLKIEKEIRWGGSVLRLILDGFNVFNQYLATEENEWTGPLWPLRYATEIESPRIFRLGINYEF